MFARWSQAIPGFLAVAALWAGLAAPAGAGIVVDQGQALPSEDPHYNVYYDLAAPIHGQIHQYDALTIFDVPIIGSNLGVVQSILLPLTGPYSGVFTVNFSKIGVYDQPTAGVGQTDNPNLYNMTFIYVGAATIDNTAGSQPLVLLHNAFGFRTIDLGSSPAIDALLVTPQQTISTIVTPSPSPGPPFVPVAGSQNNPGVVTPTLIGVPEPSGLLLASAALGLTAVARLARARRRQAA